MVRGKKLKTFGVLSVFLFFVFLTGGAVVFNAGALTTVSTDTEIRLDVDPIITVSFSTRAAILKASMKPGQLDEIKVGAEIRTNSRTGYKAYLSTDKRRKSNTDRRATGLVHLNNDIDIIPTLETSVAAENFPVNHWGYSVDGGENYAGMRAANDVDLADFVTSSASEQRNMDLYFATKIDNNQAGGFYENTIIVTAVANYVAQTINDIEYMQDINPEIALSMEEDHQYQLKDKRDNKKYWISRLRDGNIWMTQNLDFYNIEDGKLKLTQELSDVWSDIDYAVVFENRASNTTDYSVRYNNGDAPVVHFANKRFPSSYGSPTALTTNEINSDNESLKHYYLGTKYSGNVLALRTIYNQTFNTVGHNSEPDVMVPEFDEYVLNHPQSVCPKGWRYPRKDEFRLLPKHYGVMDYENWTKYTTDNNAFKTAFYPMMMSDYYNFSIITDDSTKSSGNIIGMMINNSTVENNERFFYISSGNSDAFVRCVMRW